MCWDLSERTLVRRLRVERYGETGFRCVHCTCTEGVEVSDRLRFMRCRACNRQQSVTAGTPMHGSKLPLRVWFIRGGHFEAGNVPTSGELAEEVNISRSSAWHVNQRFMRVMHLGRAPYALGQLVTIMPCRKPKGRDTDENRPPVVRDLLRYFTAQPLGQSHPTVVSLTFEGLLPRWTHVAMNHDLYHQARCNPLFQSPVVTDPLRMWLHHHIEEHHGMVCLRWLSRYIDHYLGIYAFQSDWACPPRWLERLMAGPRRKLSELRAEPVEPDPVLLERYPPALAALA